VTRPLLLVAAGGLARETAEAARASGRDVIGYLDDDPARLGEVLDDGMRVLGGLDAVDAHPEAALVVCAGKGQVRADLVRRLGERGVTESRFATVLHPSVHVPGSVHVGAGSVLLAGTVLTASVVLGRHVVCMPHVTLTHDDQIADYVTLCAATTLGGGVRVGVGAYIGAAASIRERVEVGENSIVGMGAVVLKDVPAGETWVGLPARQLRAAAVNHSDQWIGSR
jgi:sugar O-acyltransferase (sialic acid O-acetyltransferase NeuD family)